MIFDQGGHVTLSREDTLCAKFAMRVRAWLFATVMSKVQRTFGNGKDVTNDIQSNLGGK